MEDKDGIMEDDFLTEEEKAIDEVIREIGKMAVAADRKAEMLNVEKRIQIESVCKLLKEMTIGSGAEVSCVMHEPFKNTGFVSVSGRKITFRHPEWFSTIAKLAANLDMYPKTDGTVQIDFTFYDLTFPIE